MSKVFETTPQLTAAFLNSLVSELDSDEITGITLGGSYARDEATPFSDVDLACFYREGVKPPPRRLLYRDHLLVSVTGLTISRIEAMLACPEEAIFYVNAKRRALLDKDGSIEQLLQKIAAFKWEPLQEAANAYASYQIMSLAEQVQKILGRLFLKNDLSIALTVPPFLSALTLVVAVQRGILVKNDLTYYPQVYESVGQHTTWTRLHRLVIGADSEPTTLTPVYARGVAVLQLYKETVALLRSNIHAGHLQIVEQVLQIIDEAAPHLGF